MNGKPTLVFKMKRVQPKLAVAMDRDNPEDFEVLQIVSSRDAKDLHLYQPFFIFGFLQKMVKLCIIKLKLKLKEQRIGQFLEAL